MKKNTFLLSSLLFVSVLVSCNEKKLTEVVEVPLPTIQEKKTRGNQDNVKTSKGSFQLEKTTFLFSLFASSPISSLYSSLICSLSLSHKFLINILTIFFLRLNIIKNFNPNFFFFFFPFFLRNSSFFKAFYFSAIVPATGQ